MYCSIRLVFLATLASLAPGLANAQSRAADRNDNVVSVHELAKSGKPNRDFEKGSRLLLKGDPAASLPFFFRAISEDPAAYRPYHNLGLAQYRLGQLDLAAQNFQKAIDLTKGGFAPSFFALSMILYRQLDFRQAETLIRNGLNLDPGSSVGYYCLALVQFSLGHITDSERSVRDALFRNPGEADAYVLLARIHERQHNPIAVQADIQSYLKLSPDGALLQEAQALQYRAFQVLSPSRTTPL